MMVKESKIRETMDHLSKTIFYPFLVP